MPLYMLLVFASAVFSVRVAWDSRPYFTVSDLRLPFSSPSTTRRVTVEVFDPTSTRVWNSSESASLYNYGADCTENVRSIIACSIVAGETMCAQSCSLATAVVLSPVYTVSLGKGSTCHYYSYSWG
jgi:hypothetical protein